MWAQVSQEPHPWQAALRQYHQLHGTGRTADDFEEVVRAAADGQLGTLLVSPQVDVWGAVNPSDRRVTTHSTREPCDEELTNLAADHVLRHAGTVFAVPPDELTDHSALALCRLPMAKHGKGGPS